MNKCFKMMGALVLLVQGWLSAQETIPLSLSKAIDYAVEHKADAEKARLNIKKGDAEIAEVKANAFPKLTLNSNTTYNPLLQQNVLPGEMFGAPGQSVKVSFGQKWQSSNMLQLQQILFNQSVFIGLKAARSTKEFYLINAQLTEEQIIEKVAEAYYQVYQSQQMLKNLRDNLNIAQQTIKIIKGLYDAGLAKKIDYDRTLVAVNNLKASEQQLINAVQLSENALKFMIGMPMEQAIDLPEGTFEPSILISENAPSFSERTELKVLNKQIELLSWKKKASEAEYYPTVTLLANYGWLGQGAKFPFWHGEKSGVYWFDMASIGLNISVPIFNGFSTKSKIEQDKIEIEKAKADLKETELGLSLAYNNAATQLANGLITIKNQENNVQLAEEVMANTRSNYQYGLATLNDILDAEKDLAEAKNNLTKSKLDYKLAEIALLKSQGKLRTLNQK